MKVRVRLVRFTLNRMSLRVRLVILTVALVALSALALSFVYLQTLVNSLAGDAEERSRFTGQQVYALLIDNLNQHLRERDPPKTLEETKSAWNDIVASDPDISPRLEKMMALSPALLEINVAGETGEILVSSNPLRVGTPLTRLESFSILTKGSLWQRALNLLQRRPDYEATVPIGIRGQPQPMFTIQVVTSNVLLRDALLPGLRNLLYVAASALLATLLITVVATSRALGPIRRIEETIDRIAQGGSRSDESRGEETVAKEFRAMESKLNMLGQQFRGAQQNARELRQNVDQLLERMASELDVATRLSAISRLTGGVAHEIKNPLNAIALRLDLLRARLGAPEEELVKEIDVLSREVMRLDRVVKTFLDFSRPVEVHLQEVDLAELASEVAEFVKPQGKSAGISVSFEGPAAPATIRGDPDMLKQAVLNLATNAIEAMQGGGNVRIMVNVFGNLVRLEVADNGPGIPPNLRSKVFQLYFTTKARGTGIGLAMTYRAVQLHNGTIEFTSESGQGTTFRLEFPVAVRHA
jgi:signal transduction histidine kinase